jgi:nucleotide-binding universal stress UspA family protein
MRSILLHVHEEPGLEARLQVALDMAREFDAHVTCLQPVSFEVAVPGDLYGTMIAQILPELQEQADRTRERLCGRLANEDVAWDWRQEEGPARPLLQRAEGLFDLVILGTRDPASSGKGPSALTGFMAIHGGSPLLVVPKDTESFNACGAAVIGWNGSLEAAHALRGAIPLLGKAASVTIINVAEPDEDQDGLLPAVDAAEYLSRHGISCEIVEIERGNATVAQALLNSACARGAAYLIVGAYGHSRALETVFGGVTHELLADPSLPIFTAH